MPINLARKPDVLQQGRKSRAVLDIIASKWTILVVYALQQNTKRYNEIKRSLPDITQKVLTETLRNLERDGIVQRTVHPVIPPKVEYRLTTLGLKLLNITGTMAEWAEKYCAEVNRSQKAYDRAARHTASL